MNYTTAFWAAAILAAVATAIAIQQAAAKKKQAEQFAQEKQTLQQIISRLQYGAMPEVGGGTNYPAGVYTGAQQISDRADTQAAPMYETR